MEEQKRYSVGLFVTCLVNVFRPSIAQATVELLEQVSCDVSVPVSQSCCGQPGYNAGDIASTTPLAQQMISAFETFDYVVAPSGSCAAMIKEHYPRLFEEGSDWHKRSLALAAKTFEICGFLVDVLQVKLDQKIEIGDRRISYHDSCAGYREMGIKSQARTLIADRCDAQVYEMPDTDVCCGFGGTFCTKMPDISLAMADEKLANALSVEATTLVGGDLGCLLHLAGREGFEKKANGRSLEIRHIVELLTGSLSTPAIGKD